MGAAAMPVMIAMTAASGVMQHQQGKAAAQSAENEAKRAGEQEEAQLREEQIERRERLIRSLSAQNAAVGASGGQLSGSALNIMNIDQENFENEDLRAGLSGKSRVGAIKSSGKNRAAGHRLGANLSLVDTASRLGSIAATDFKAPKKSYTLQPYNV